MMKYWMYVPLFVLASCSSKPETAQEAQSAVSMPEKSKAVQERKDLCWSGTLAQKVPVFIHYQVEEDIVSGTITYLNTKSKTPIRLIGTIASDGEYRLLEFEPSGNITGIITGQPGQNEFSGSWFSPRTRKSLDMKLVKSDSLVAATVISAAADNIYGDYHYQYSEDGPRGDFSISRAGKDKAAFQIFSVTSDPARNMADVGTDTISLSGTSFIYKIPDTDSCEFKVRCYKDFVHIDYTHGYCDGQFGHNATIEGIFLKVAK